MTETVVALVVNELVQLITHESNLLKGVQQEVVDIKDELESIQYFLKDVDKVDLQDGVKIWVKQVREAAYHIEDVIDEYVLHVAQRRHQQTFLAFLNKIGHLLEYIKPRPNIATKIQDIKISIREIKERSNRYGFSSSEQGSSNSAANVTWHDPRVGALFIEEDEVVGIESTRDELKILMSMIDQIYQGKETALEQIDMTDEITLITQLRKFLQQKRYVVVFDDVWKTEFWEIVKHALPFNDRGSRIIITTRSDLIAAFSKESFSDHVHKLQPLSQDKAWELFCKKAFWSEFQGCCPKELVKMSMDIVRKCEGLPLAIVAIGGLLSTKEKVPLEWKKLHDSLNSELECNPHLTIRKYRIHDLLHEIILSKAVELNICQVLEASDTTFHGKSRCLSIHDARENVFETSEYSRVRSIFLFNINEMPKSFIVKLFKKFKLLKVLDFEDAPIDCLPQEVGNLFHLKHLSLRRTKVKILPKSVGRLQNLETLNVMETIVRELPVEIFRLYKLRHILAHSHDYEIKMSFYSMKGVRVHEGVGCLNDLQTLSLIEANQHGDGLFEELGRLSQLRMLGIGNMTAERGRALCASIQNMVRLKTLIVGSISEVEIIDLQSISSPPPFLEHLFLRGRLEKLPNWISELTNLVTLILSISSLEEDPLPYVQALPNLITISLNHAYDGEQLHFKEGSFRKLKRITMREMKKLKIMEIDRGSLPNLVELEIGPCSQMKEVPSGIQHLKSLRNLDFYEMPREIVLSMQPDGGKDYWKVKKVTTVCFWYRIKGEQYQKYRLGDSELLERLQLYP
ncbi:hypothetical protein FH972_026777 [Carpinus fangiana]|uniref:Rx N-terminal domain-containing protein n=1 Tax=Carpinus fangiana TaxID=176857 RepID=A0A5N6L7H8_9ROSI|nr:hypothetical protein FH972_026777 [Carpinus fangiana]